MPPESKVDLTCSLKQNNFNKNVEKRKIKTSYERPRSQSFVPQCSPNVDNQARRRSSTESLALTLSLVSSQVVWIPVNVSGPSAATAGQLSAPPPSVNEKAVVEEQNEIQLSPEQSAPSSPINEMSPQTPHALNRIASADNSVRIELPAPAISHQRDPAPSISHLREQSPFVRQNDSNMYSEDERLKTFANWNVSFLSPESMVKAGFYYLKRSDLVRCPFCGIEIGRWEEADEPLTDHRKWSPSCQFLANPSTSGNVPHLDSGAIPNAVMSSEAPSQTSTESGHDVCGGMEKGSSSTEESIGVQKVRSAVFPEFFQLDKRLESFNAWPVSLRIRPASLANAGFFYTGKGDQTICFYCGGGLKDWEEDDDPWVEHAKWFHKCFYVIMSKGEQFIADVRSKMTKQTEDTSPSTSSSPPLSEKPKEVPSESCSEAGKESSKPATVNEQLLCKICYTKEMCVVFLPCQHLIACVDCAVSMSICGVCRQPIKSQLRTFLS